MTFRTRYPSRDRLQILHTTRLVDRLPGRANLVRVIKCQRLRCFIAHDEGESERCPWLGCVDVGCGSRLERERELSFLCRAFLHTYGVFSTVLRTTNYCCSRSAAAFSFLSRSTLCRFVLFFRRLSHVVKTMHEMLKRSSGEQPRSRKLDRLFFLLGRKGVLVYSSSTSKHRVSLP